MQVVEYVRTTVKMLSGEEPNIEAEQDADGMVIKVTATGKVATVIGKQGKTIDAIRVVAKAIGVDGTRSHKIKVIVNGSAEYDTRN